ncbi:hypothetical protein IHE55_06930 [Streptomyces pactum]|uniref:Uncharacterized protein n=1 Tax=Streptomyces pactum TaxID=68249 RepID=A0ABS0NHG8_9ACTN|nr:hypothetical protein [Streptomyces pactum]MBH5334549.1 hypothetical protein [Streptomyces pactum]
MDAVRIALLREALAGTEWLAATRRFGGALRASVRSRSGGLLVVGSEEYEPWHLAAHLRDEAAWSDLPQLSPTLVRHRVPDGVPDHLSVGLGRLEAAGRGETLLVVSPGEAGAGLLERVHDARRGGTTVFALDGGDRDLRSVAHEALTAPPDTGLDLEVLQHLVSAAAGENPGPGRPGRPRLRELLSRFAERLTTPPPRW